MALRRGFKTEANWWSRSLRAELGLGPASPMCPRKLAAHLSLPLLTLTEFTDIAPQAVQYLSSQKGQRDFSGVTITYAGERWIIHNDANDPGRQAADIAHEIAHALLQHPVTAMFQSDGSRSHNKEHEEEANWLGPTLLVSDEAALFAAYNRLSVGDAAELYGVSRDLMQMRLNVSGARKRVA
ncbi:MAG: ImmA/IrrE family metallo-endopeptidase [Devosia sp.]|nr:ImmA/IrrE family metallo-endopeptidase [Devosia sp.]